MVVNGIQQSMMKDAVRRDVNGGLPVIEEA